MGLFTPKWETTDKEKAKKAVEKENDPLKLCEIAKNAPLNEVKIYAVEKITDDSVLRDIALNSDSKEIRKTALFRISKEEYIPLKEKGCEFFGMEHTWQNGEDCSQICMLCGNKTIHHVWNKGVCLKCGVRITDLDSLTEFRLSDILDPRERGIIFNALNYSIKNWGNAEEEKQICVIAQKCASAGILDRSEVIFLIRIYRTLLQLFNNNPELKIEQMNLLPQIANLMPTQ